MTIQDKETGTVRDMTYGEEAVGLTFNPSQDSRVASIKEAYAAIIDLLWGERAGATTETEQEEFDVAITQAKSGQMWAVKAITRRKK